MGFPNEKYPSLAAIHQSWQSHLLPFFESQTFHNLSNALNKEASEGLLIYPPAHLRFRCFASLPLTDVKCVILGQDPYHQIGQANGLSFSINEGCKIPPSLRNVLKELQTDLATSGNSPRTNFGDLSHWVSQGVLLMNGLFSVRDSAPLSHQNLGWEELTKLAISALNSQCSHVVFIMWGKFAMKYAHGIDTSKHLIIGSAHPSPLSAHHGFWGSKPFSKTNEWLQMNGKSPIVW